MKVLVVHNRYRSDSPSGETKTVDEEIARLTSAGVTVEPFFRSSDEIDSFGLRDRALLPLAPITGGPSRKSFAVALKSFRPDLVHLHNPYPLISPSIIREIGRAHV